jgi:hypothetical protein
MLTSLAPTIIGSKKEEEMQHCQLNLDNHEYDLVSSLGLSAAFEVVNVKLLVKRVKIPGLPEDVTKLINEYYTDINGCTSTLFELLLGAVQGSILGPIRYVLFLSQYWEKQVSLYFANGSYLPKCSKSLPQLINHMEKSLEAMTKWLRLLK